jgi:P4 family phage/plasmid primase-like protien
MAAHFLHLPIASVSLPPCIEYAIRHGPEQNEEMDWVFSLTRFWKSWEVPEEVLLPFLIEWFNDSDSAEPMDDKDIGTFVSDTYAGDRTRPDCEELARLQSFKKGCARADCPFYNPREASCEIPLPALDMDEVKKGQYPVNVYELANQLVRHLNIRRLPGGSLAVYNQGIYVIEDAEAVIESIVRDYLKNELTIRLRANLFLHIKAAADPVVWDDFERFTHLLCCPNCVVDLQTLQILDHSPHYMMLHKTAVNYRPKAKSELWDKTLEEIIPPINLSPAGLDNFEDQLDYIQTAWGYSISGETRNEAFFIHQGAGGCGKNTITWPIQGAMGSYVQQVDPNILTAKNDYFKPDYELAMGIGKRIFLTNESKDGAKLNGQLIKSIATEGAVFNARQIREKPFAYILRAKAHLVMNPPPIIDEQDKSIERRLHYIQYQADFTGKADLTLKTRLRKREESEAILAWLVQGAHKYYKTGLHRTDAVNQAVKDLMSEGDPLYGFVDANLELSPGDKIYSDGLIQAFKTHCNTLLITTDKLDPRSFGRMLNAQIKLKGWKVKSNRSHGRTVYQDLKFKSVNEGGA